MKKKQFKIQDLEVSSFVTAFEKDMTNTVKGQLGGQTNGPQPEICPNTVYPDHFSICAEQCRTNFTTCP